MLAQRHQARRVIDLSIHEQDRADAGIASPAPGLKGGEGLDLGSDIGRGVEQHPVYAIRAHCDGRLRPRAAGQLASAQPATVVAVAVPLGEATAGTGPEYADLHLGRSMFSALRITATAGDACEEVDLAAGWGGLEEGDRSRSRRRWRSTCWPRFAERCPDGGHRVRARARGRSGRRCAARAVRPPHRPGTSGG